MLNLTKLLINLKNIGKNVALNVVKQHILTPSPKLTNNMLTN